MGYRYQDATGRAQLAEDINVLHQALKAGRLSPDSMVLDESVSIRLKAAALIAFKARESVQARAGAVSAPAVNKVPRRPAHAAPRVRALSDCKALPSQQPANRTNKAAWLLGLSLVGLLALGLISLQSFMAESSSESKAAAEKFASEASKTGAAAEQMSATSAPGNGSVTPQPVKQPLGREELLKSVLPLLRQSHEEMLQNNARYHQGVDHLNLGQSMAPEVLLSRDGLARNAVRFQSFNGTLERFAQAEEARMQRLVQDVHRALDNRVGGPEFVKRFEEGLSQSRRDQDDFIRIQRELSGLFQHVTDFMLARQGAVSLRDGALVFSNEADAATYRQMMKELDRLAREEAVLQASMLGTMTRMGDLLDEWSR